MPTYVIYGDAGDGRHTKQATTYDIAREAGDTAAWSNTPSTAIVGQRYDATWTYPYWVYQAFLGWNTGIIPTDEIIESSFADMYATTGTNDIDLTFQFRPYTWTSPVDSDDWVPASQLVNYPVVHSVTIPAGTTATAHLPVDLLAQTKHNTFVSIMVNDQRQETNVAPTTAAQYIAIRTTDNTVSWRPVLIVQTRRAATAAYPVSLLTQTNLTGDITTIQNDPDVPDNIWMTAVTGGEYTELRTDFNVLPAGKKFDGNQTFYYRARTSGTDDVEVGVYLYEAGAEVAHLTNQLIASAESTYSVTWAPELLTNPSADNVEIRIVHNATGAASSVEIESIVFYALFVDDVVVTPTYPRAQTDFSTTDIGLTPTGWSHLWNTASVSKVVAADDAVGGKLLALDDSANTRRAFAWDAAGSTADIDIVMRARYERITSNASRIYARASGLAGSENGVFGELFGYFTEHVDADGNTYYVEHHVLRLGVYHAGGYSPYGEYEIPLRPTFKWYRLRFRVVGERCRMKLWTEGTTEPPWQIDTIISPIPVTGAGPAAIGGYTSYIDSNIDVVGVAFDGDIPDPLPPVGSKTDKHPPPPPNVYANQVDEGVELNWDAVTDVTGYKVLRNGYIVADVGAATTYTDSEVIHGPETVKNGRGQYGDLTNFLSFDSYTDGGFYTDDYYASKFSDEYIPVDTTKTYTLDAEWRGAPGIGQKHYVGIATYDAMKLHIDHTMVSRRATGVLAQDLKPGDTQMHLVDSTGWENAGVGHQRTLQLFPYVDAEGRTYDFASGYSRHIVYDGTNGAWPAGGVVGNSITLTKAFELRNPGHVDGWWLAGTEVANTQSGGTYIYALVGNGVISDNLWHGAYGAKIEPPVVGVNSNNRFRPGTAFVRMMFLPNREVRGATIYRNISFQPPRPTELSKSEYLYSIQSYRRVV